MTLKITKNHIAIILVRSFVRAFFWGKIRMKGNNREHFLTDSLTLQK